MIFSWLIISFFSGRSTKSLHRPPHRASGHSHHMKSASARSSARSHKQSINPVTRLIDADQNRADSSTATAYGQINPGFTGDQRRPNSIYNLSLNPPTDVEASRPQSTLTSYSNFHHQRRPGPNGSNVPNGGLNNQNRPVGVTNLTQESLMNVSRAGARDTVKQFVCVTTDPCTKNTVAARLNL